MAFTHPHPLPHHPPPPGPRPPAPAPAHLPGLPPDNPLLFQAFEWYLPSDASHWRRLATALPALRRLGISQMWIPPACKAGWYTGNGYDLYDLWDLGEFEQKGARHTKWGTKEELVAMAETARAVGVGVLFDVVLNHKAAADHAEEVRAVKIDPKDRNVALEEPTTIEAWCKYDFPGRGTTYSPLKWGKEHFNGIDYDDRHKAHGVWKFEGKEWARDVDEELGNYDYLMFANVDHSHPAVRRDLFAWIQWLGVQLPGLGGVRLDAIKHYSAAFLRDFVKHMDATVGRGGWFIVGEYWREDVDVLAKYIEYMDHRLSLFDVRLVSNFSRLSTCVNSDLRSVFEGALVGVKPGNTVTFVTNHDTMEGQSLETPVAEYFQPLAYALILLRHSPSLPCVFYGDLYGFTRPHGPGFIRPLPYLPKLMLARKLYAYGPQTDYFDVPHCIGWTRAGAPGVAPFQHSSKGAGLAVVMTNARRWATKTMCVGVQHAGEVWTDVLGGCWGEVRIDEGGFGVFAAGPRSVSVWVARGAVGREEIDLCDFDCDIYGTGFRREKAATAGDMYRPRLSTQPAWMNGG